MNERPARVRRPVDGLLLLDKPAGLTSNTALQKAKRLFSAAKAGHTGNLDPFATGLLPLCFGEATKFSQFLLDADKTYLATVRLGITTTTGDPEGEVLVRRPVTVGRDEVETALAHFRGEIEQIPPMYSALKRDGKPLYEYARAGVEVEREARRVTIHALTLEAWEGETFSFTVACSKGTYVRTLAEDIGAALGCGAHLTGLRRTASGRLTLEGAVTLEALEAMAPEARDRCLLPPDTLMDEYPRVDLDGESAFFLGRGQAVWKAGVPTAGLVRVYDDKGRFLGAGEIQDDGRIAPRRLVAG